MNSHSNKPAFPVDSEKEALRKAAPNASAPSPTTAADEQAADAPVARAQAVPEKHVPAKHVPGKHNIKPLFLLIEQGPAAGCAFQIVQGSCVIGRTAEADLCLQHPSVSRRHAQLRRLGNHLYVRDLGSQNGTYVNQQRILDETEVFAGDAVAIGNSLLQLKDALLMENVPQTEKKPPAKSRRAPYYTLLVAGLTASFSTLLAMLLLKLLFQPSTPSGDVEISPVQASESAAFIPPQMPEAMPPDAVPPDTAPPDTAPPNDVPSSELPPPDSPSGHADKVPPPPPGGSPSSTPPVNEASILQAFNQARANDALSLAKEANHLLLAEQLAAFLPQWEMAENFWQEVEKTKTPPSPQALAAHEEALRAAAQISADSDYVRQLRARLNTLRQMAASKPASPAKASVRPSPSSSKQPSSASKELQEKRRAIDEAFGF